MIRNRKDRRTRAPRRSGQRGAATLVEAAFAVPILMIFVLGVMDFSRAVYAYHFVSDAAREASRYASVRGHSCNIWSSACPAAGSDIASYVQTLEPSGLNFTNPASSTTACTSSSGAGCISVITDWPGQSGGWPSGCTTAASPKNYPGCPVKVTVTYTFGFFLQSHFSISNIALPSTSEFIITQ